jgi:hypothetical protein
MSKNEQMQTEDNEKRIEALSSLAHISLQDIKPAAIKRQFPSIILAVFFIALLLALIAGVLVYKNITDVQQAANVQRQGVGLVTNAVRANDSDGAIAVGQGPEGRSLVIKERLASGTYEMRYYLYNGEVLQEYSLEGTAYTPEKGTVVTTSNSFDFSYSDGLLTVTTDDDTSEVALRSLIGGE